MIEPESLDSLSKEVQNCVTTDRGILDRLRQQVRPLRGSTRRIHPHATTAISLVGTDGGNNQLSYDPFVIQIVRVVDSSRNEYCLEAITPTYDLELLRDRHIDVNGRGRTPLGKMMVHLGVKTLPELSTMIPRASYKGDDVPKPSWMQVYRELTEWAVLFELVRDKDFATDTVIICDGFLRSKVFAGTLFKKYREGLEEGIHRHFTKARRRIYIAGIAKHSDVLRRYRLPMALEGVMRTFYPAYVEVPRALELAVYKWGEYARGSDTGEPGEENKFVAGKMFFVKFGSRPADPIWAIDLLESQVADAAAIFGYLLADALDGFPIPLYPMCLQRAHENAALFDFDMDVVRDQILAALRGNLSDKASVLDELEIQETDVTGRRYGR